jgi:glycerol-3-phosphate acyltransferase PlsY
MTPALLILGGFLCGSIPFSWFLGRLRGVDLRNFGSGNPGATNLLRTCGKGPGITGLLLDTAKGALPVYAAINIGTQADWIPAAVTLAAVGGHVFMPWFGFKGGKGVATALGALLVLSTYPVLCGLGVFIILVAVSRMISLGSVIGGLSLPFWGFLFPQPIYSGIVLVVIAVSILITHRSNIQRLFSGTERKLGQK